ncbi:MAG TPA: hypothetical protein VJ867_01935, partial [Gemmatimonadaceae bacterium]|nr:hypothetical protein [Gemmatimonadaceae bacterium]
LGSLHRLSERYERRRRVKKLAIVLLLVSACHRTVVTGSPSAQLPGGATPSEALSRFMAAAKAQDLQAFALVWGSKDGPVIQTMAKEDREMREITMLCYLKHDSYRIISQTPSTNNQHVFNVELKFKDLTRSTNFFATLGPSNRWYVLKVDKMDPLRDICASH